MEINTSGYLVKMMLQYQGVDPAGQLSIYLQLLALSVDTMGDAIDKRLDKVIDRYFLKRKKWECGDKIGFHGCYRKINNEILKDHFGEENLIPGVELQDNRQMWNHGSGNRDFEDAAKGLNFHKHLRSLLETMITEAKQECKKDDTCCKEINICVKTSSREIRRWIFNNSRHHLTIGESSMHSEVLKYTNYWEYIRKNECIKIKCK